MNRVLACAVVGFLGCGRVCRPHSQTPYNVACESNDGGPSASITATMVLNETLSPQVTQPGCRVELDGGDAHLVFTADLCETLGNEPNGDVRFFYASCTLPEGTWAIAETSGPGLVAMVTDAGIRCQRR